jgi:NAD(P)H-hydrate epimerase
VIRVVDPPVVAMDSVPWLSVDQMIEVDRVMIDEMRISLIQMMENAGRNLAMVARWMLGNATGGRVVVLAGPGGNGGGGLVCARHLAVAGADVRVALGTGRAALAEVPTRQLDSIGPSGVSTDADSGDVASADLVVDALLGYSGRGAPRGRMAELAEASHGRKVLALDSPTGLELATGAVPGVHVRADVTMTLALPKDGLRAPQAGPLVGRLLLADISVPAAVYDRMGLAYTSPFGDATVVELGS